MKEKAKLEEDPAEMREKDKNGDQQKKSARKFPTHSRCPISDAQMTATNDSNTLSKYDSLRSKSIRRAASIDQLVISNCT